MDWQASLEMGLPPALDSSISTYETVRGLHPDIDPKGEVQITLEEAVSYLDTAVGEDDAKTAHRDAKIQAMQRMGDAKYLKCGDVKIADRRAKAGGAPYVQFNKKANLTDA